MTAAEATVKENGVIIMAARCSDGHGGEVFHRTFRNNRDLNALMASFLATPAEETIVDQWQSRIFARVLLKASVIFISDAPDEMVRELHMPPAHSMEEALALADKILTEHGIVNGSVLAIPVGVSLVVR